MRRIGAALVPPLAGLGLAAALAGAAVPQGSSQPRAPGTDTSVTLTPDQSRRLASDLIGAGEGDAARAILAALLERDPDDAVALLLLARAERAARRDRPAFRLARRAYGAAVEDGLRYAAAFGAAEALVMGGRVTRGQLWLRRAAQVAPDDAARAHVERQFRVLRRINPLSVNLSFSVVPSSNVNNGAQDGTVDLFGLPFQLSGTAQALSGVEAAAGVSLRYRLSETEARATEAGLMLFHRAVRLSDAARAIAPGARGSDFTFQAAEVSVRHRLRADDAAGGAWTGQAVLGRNWFGGSTLTDYLRLSAGRSLPLNQATALSLEVTGEWRDRRDQAARSSDSVEAVARLDHRRASGDRAGLHFGLRDTGSASTAIDHSGILAGLRYALADPVAGVGLSAALDLEWRDYGADPLAPGGREDIHATLGVTATLHGVDYYGFSPTVELRARGVFSDVRIYDTREYGLRLGIVSNF